MPHLSQGGKHRKARALPLPRMVRGQTGDPMAFRKWEQKARSSKEEWRWQSGIVTHPLSEGQWNRGRFSMTKWESENWGMPAGEGHVATDGALGGTAGKCGACGWSVVQLDSDGELGRIHGMYGSMEAEFEVPRTVKRAQLTTCLCFLKKVIGPIKVACRHCMNHRWSMEMRKENALIRRLAMLICGSKSCKKCTC